MPSFPNEVFDPIEFENVPGAVYDENKKSDIYAERLNAIQDEVRALELNFALPLLTHFCPIPLLFKNLDFLSFSFSGAGRAFGYLFNIPKTMFVGSVLLLPIDTIAQDGSARIAFFTEDGQNRLIEAEISSLGTAGETLIINFDTTLFPAGNYWFFLYLYPDVQATFITFGSMKNQSYFGSKGYPPLYGTLDCPSSVFPSNFTPLFDLLIDETELPRIRISAPLA
jgi:hypothetical protein